MKKLIACILVLAMFASVLVMPASAVADTKEGRIGSHLWTAYLSYTTTRAYTSMTYSNSLVKAVTDGYAIMVPNPASASEYRLSLSTSGYSRVSKEATRTGDYVLTKAVCDYYVGVKSTDNKVAHMDFGA